MKNLVEAPEAGSKRRRHAGESICLTRFLLMRPAALNFTDPCKLALAATAVSDDPSRIERGSDREFLLAKISESRFLSSRRRSNIVPRATVSGGPSPLAR